MNHFQIYSLCSGQQRQPLWVKLCLSAHIVSVGGWHSCRRYSALYSFMPHRSKPIPKFLLLLHSLDSKQTLVYQIYLLTVRGENSRGNFKKRAQDSHMVRFYAVHSEHKHIVVHKPKVLLKERAPLTLWHLWKVA